MLAYAQDAMETEKPWERWEWFNEYDQEWETLALNPKWGLNAQYRRKPRTININGFEVPEPVREPLERWTAYYMPCIQPYLVEVANSSEWNNDECDHEWLKAGIIHLTKEAAEIHAKALLSFTITQP